MRRLTLRIVEYHHSATAKYCIEGLRVNGKRKRLFFSTRDSAERELQRLKIKQRREGDTALAIPDSLRIMASECAEKLKPFGKTLVDATEFFLKQLGDGSAASRIGCQLENRAAAVGDDCAKPRKLAPPEYEP